MGMLYREDIFAAHGITVPTTWDGGGILCRGPPNR